MHYRRYRYVTQFIGKAAATRAKARKVPFGFVLEVTQFSGGLSVEETRQVELGYIDAAGNDRILARAKHEDYRYVEVRGKPLLVADEQPYVIISNMGDDKTGFLSVHGKLWPTKEMIAKDAEVQRESDVSGDIKPQ